MPQIFLVRDHGKAARTSERIMADSPFQHASAPIRAQEELLARRRHACRCVARVIVDGVEEGTGFLLPDDWFLTCHHVLPDAGVAGRATSTAQFDYAMGTDGQISDPTQFHFDPARFHCSAADDWTLVKLTPHVQKGLASVRYLGGLSIDKVLPATDAKVYVVQHPLAETQKVADSIITAVSAERIWHTVPTEGGSSGSPIFDESWRVIGMHRGRKGEQKEGTSIGVIVDGIQAAGCWPLARAGLAVVDESGPMAEDSPWYVERSADKVAAEHLIDRQGVTLAIKGPAMLGKSSLAVRLQAKLVARRWQAVNIDLRGDCNDEHFATAHAFFRRVAEEILAQAGGDETALKVFERDGTPGSFPAFLHELGRDSSRPLLLVMDRLDALGGRPCCSPVLTGLRVVHNRQQTLRQRGWLKMILITTVRPRQVGPDGSVFDVAKPVNLADFTLPELHRLISCYGKLHVDASRLHDFLGGHPALSRQALNEIADGRTALDDLIGAAQRDGGIFREHLRKVAKAIRESPDGTAVAADFRGLVEGRTVISEEKFEALVVHGLVQGADAATARPRGELYARWLPAHLPK